MHSNWPHCLQEFFISGKLAENSYHQNTKNIVFFNYGKLPEENQSTIRISKPLYETCLKMLTRRMFLSRKIIPSGFQNFAEKPEDVTLEDVSSTQQYEENLMYSERVKKQQVPKEDDRSVIPVLKLATST